jgi:hypothetical protein
LEKFGVLLDETTIINFKLIWKLVGRYRAHLTVAAISFTTLFIYFYFSQPVVFSTTVPIKVVAKHTVSNDMQSLVQVESTSSVTLNELTVTFSGYSFIKSYAEAILKDPEFERLNFGSIVNGRSLMGYTIMKNCNNVQSCMIDQLITPLSGTFILEQGATENRYLLTVNGLTDKTVHHLTDVLIKAIEVNRKAIRQYLVVKEIDSVESLIKESRSILSGVNGIRVLEDNESIAIEIADLKEKIRNLFISINQESTNLTTLEAKLNENRRALKNSDSGDQLNKLNQRMLQIKINEIRQNISSLSSIPMSNRSTSDQQILERLNAELVLLEKQVPIDSAIKSMEAGDEFENAQRHHEKSTEFEYLVSKGKLNNLKIEYSQAKARLDSITKDRISKESSITRIKSDLEFLKSLESKQLSLKLMSTTMTSDLLFEDFGRGTREFRRSSVGKILLFSFFLTGFVYMFSILIRYFIDDRIYSEDDLKTHFLKLDFVGEVPSFD